MGKNIEEQIEQLYGSIEVHEKIYALAIKMKKDSHTLENLKTKITESKDELTRLHYLQTMIRL